MTASGNAGLCTGYLPRRCVVFEAQHWASLQALYYSHRADNLGLKVLQSAKCIGRSLSGHQYVVVVESSDYVGTDSLFGKLRRHSGGQTNSG